MINNLIDQYNNLIQITDYTPKHEIHLLDQILEDEDITLEIRAWANRRLRFARARLSDPSPRYQIVGSRGGRLSQCTQSQIDILQLIQSIRTQLQGEPDATF